MPAAFAREVGRHQPPHPGVRQGEHHVYRGIEGRWHPQLHAHHHEAHQEPKRVAAHFGGAHPAAGGDRAGTKTHIMFLIVHTIIKPIMNQRRMVACAGGAYPAVQVGIVHMRHLIVRIIVNPIMHTKACDVPIVHTVVDRAEPKRMAAHWVGADPSAGGACACASPDCAYHCQAHQVGPRFGHWHPSCFS
eukprot:640661-Pelagomonas_calceolata.AAC.7